MKFHWKNGWIVMSLLAAFFLAACGGGGGDSSAPPTPVVVTGSATGITNVGATLNGTVNPNGLATEAWFEWGTSSTLATFDNTDKQAFPAGTTVQSVSASIPGLTLGTTYYFRMAASNSSGVTKGNIGNFSTTAQRPTVTTLAADNLAPTSATLHGQVNPNSLATQAWFEHSTDNVTFTPTTAVPVGSGSGVVSTSANLTGLIPAGTVYFRAAASNAAGEQKGTILTLSTSNPPPVANAGPDNTVIMGKTTTLNGTGSSTPLGTITSYLWKQVNGTPVTLSDNSAVSPTFTAPDNTLPIGEVLRFQLTVTDSRALTASDNVDITVKWGSLDDFSTDTRSFYTLSWFAFDPPPPLPWNNQFNWDSVGKRLEILMQDDLGLIFSKPLPTNNSGVFSLDFYPTKTYPIGGGIWIRLMADADNYYEIAAFQWDNVLAPGELPRVTKVVGGVAVDNVAFSNINNYVSQPTPTAYHVTFTFTPTVTTVQAFGETIVLNSNTTSINVSKVELQINQQEAFYDNIQLLAVP